MNTGTDLPLGIGHYLLRHPRHAHVTSGESAYSPLLTPHSRLPSGRVNFNNRRLPTLNRILVIVFTKLLQRFAGTSKGAEPTQAEPGRPIFDDWIGAVDSKLMVLSMPGSLTLLEKTVCHLDIRSRVALTLRDARYEWTEIANLFGTTVSSLTKEINISLEDAHLAVVRELQESDGTGRNSGRESVNRPGTGDNGNPHNSVAGEWEAKLWRSEQH